MDVGTIVTSTDRYNEIIRDRTVLTLIRHLARQDVGFSSDRLVNYLAGIKEFPFFSARNLLSAAEAAGVNLIGRKVAISEIRHCGTPFLTYMESLTETDHRVQLVEVIHVDKDRMTMSNGPAGPVDMSLKKLARFWTGVVFLTPYPGASEEESELEAYRRQVAVLPSILSDADCAEMIEYCEQRVFRRSRVSNGDERLARAPGVIEQKVRNSTSLILEDRRYPLLDRLYRNIADLEGVDERDIEQIQCVRYKIGQRFTTHFDAAVEVPRKTTYLLYLNRTFGGGDTYFPMLNLNVEPLTGNCLRFPSCDAAGRIYWQSEHGGLPVTNGTKYALNIWVHISGKAV